MKMKKQKVYLIGAGPGKADLITLRGANILKEADVVIYDYLVDKRILENVKDNAELICCDKLANKGKHSKASLICQDKINNLLVTKAKKGRKVVRLKNGDSSIFSRCSQELEALVKEGIEFEIVPGVTAASAASCFSGIPLTDRRFSSSCVFVTGQEDTKKKKSSLDWEAISKCGTIVLYMAVNNLERIIGNLLRAKKAKNTPVAIVQNISLPNQKILTAKLTDIVLKAKMVKLKPPAVVIIGEVVKFESKFNWLKKNKRILFTGLSQERFFLQGSYLHLPLIKIEPMENYGEFDEHLKKIAGFDWIIFTSRYGVKYFFQRLKLIGYDARKLAKVKIAAIGESTAKGLKKHGLLADLIPINESTQGLIEEFKKKNIRGKKIFLPRSDISDKGIEAALKKLGHEITASFAYRNLMPKELPQLHLEEFNELMFTSPSTVRNFKKRYQKLPKSIKTSCIGAVTLKEAKRCRLLN